MDIWKKYKSPLGYETGDNKVDTFGVDHSQFSLRDEIEYQTARAERENQLIQNYNNQGITENYPQVGTNFWGNPENNYGFGSSNISQNIQDVTNRFNRSGYSDYGLLLQPDTLTMQGAQYAQMVNPHTATDVNNSQQIDYSLYGDGFSQEFINQMLNDQRFQQIMRNRTHGNEGGYSNHPNDRGGETMYGISSRWYPHEDIPNLTRERANALLYRDYWLAPHINQLPDEFADIVFDNSVVQGQPTAIMNLQRVLGVQADGLIGPNTLNAVLNADEDVRRNFIQQVHQRNQNIVQQDPSQRVFLNGWTDRANNY